MKKHFYQSFLIIFIVGFFGCSPKVSETVQNTEVNAPSTVKALPSYLIYKMHGDYADFVPITLNAEGNTIISYPAPTDISISQKPVALGNGWFLDRRGIGIYSAFTDFTYEEYSMMDKTPSIDLLMSHIIARKGVSAIYDCGTQRRTVDEFKKLVADGFPGCKSILVEK